MILRWKTESALERTTSKLADTVGNAVAMSMDVSWLGIEYIGEK